VKKHEIDKRIYDEAVYIIDTKVMVRDAAKVFGVSKSTIWSDMTKKLKYIYYSLYLRILEHLSENRSMRVIRGGITTKNKYAHIRSMKMNFVSC